MFHFSRRINRLTYIVGWLGAIGILLVLSFLIGSIIPDDGQLNDGAVIGIIILFLSLIAYWIFLTKQRVNDISGRHAVLLFILGVSIVPIALIFALLPGEKRPNKYGQIPHKGLALIK